MTGKTVQILMVDDDKADVQLAKESLKGSKLKIQMHHVSDGEECLTYLREEDSKPDLILLDLNMPKLDGRQVLVELKKDAAVKHIPVVILTTSASEADIEEMYKLGANCYVTKPVDFDQFRNVVNGIADFWFTVVKLPEGHD